MSLGISVSTYRSPGKRNMSAGPTLNMLVFILLIFFLPALSEIAKLVVLLFRKLNSQPE
jgi:hypothetical protein